MTVTFHPAGLLVTAVFLAVFGVLLAAAVNVETAVSGAGLLSLVSYVLIEVFGSFNPAVWRHAHRTDASDSTTSPRP